MIVEGRELSVLRRVLEWQVAEVELALLERHETRRGEETGHRLVEDLVE